MQYTALTEIIMSRRNVLIHAVLWASAIVAAASAGAPSFFTLVLLPSLASAALLLQAPRQPCISP
jgi:hypothetical protein